MSDFSHLVQMPATTAFDLATKALAAMKAKRKRQLLAGVEQLVEENNKTHHRRRCIGVRTLMRHMTLDEGRAKMAETVARFNGDAWQQLKWNNPTRGGTMRERIEAIHTTAKHGDGLHFVNGEVAAEMYLWAAKAES
jgi:hypothetical protein